jgi:hypothetical protein
MLYQLSYASLLGIHKPKSMASRIFPPHGTSNKSYHNGILRASSTLPRHFCTFRPIFVCTQHANSTNLKIR